MVGLGGSAATKVCRRAGSVRGTAGCPWKVTGSMEKGPVSPRRQAKHSPARPPRALGLRARANGLSILPQTFLLEEVQIMSLFTWLRPWKATPRRSRTGRAQRTRFRPGLEALEDRLTPSSQSLSVAVIGGPASINGGFLPESGADLPGISFTNLSPSSVNAATLANHDTVLLHVSGSQGMFGNINNLSAQAKQDIVSFVGSGHKLIIYNSETALQDYSWLPYPFQTSNPGALGASGTVTVVENNTLSSNTDRKR